MYKVIASIIFTLIFLNACGSSGSSANSSEKIAEDNPPPLLASPQTDSAIKLNQLGYLPNALKVAIVPLVTSESFQLIAKASGESVFKGSLSAALQWYPAGEEQFMQADFSAFNTPGQYLLRVTGVKDSPNFSIDDAVYSSLHDAAVKSYYFNRASTELTSANASDWQRPAGHLDLKVKIHPSAASEFRAEASTIDASKGWYDAGDYGKYTVNSGITTYTLLAAFADFPVFYQDRQLNIPESTDTMPDLLNEVLWNLAWLETMQDLDGGVYHKLTTLDWPGQEMPHQDSRERYVIGKSTAATLNFAAVLAVASRVYQPYDAMLSTSRQQWLNAAESAWNWALEHPKAFYLQPAGVNSGEYGDTSLADEFAWAAAELFIATQEIKYFQHFLSFHHSIAIPSWQNVSYLAISSLLMNAEALISKEYYQQLEATQLTLANSILTQHQNSEYMVAMQEQDFVWGSNAVALNKAMVLSQAYQLTKESKYRHATLALVDYILGRNPTDYSFVTGFGSKTPMAPHHRISASDNIVLPIPGMLVGGPNKGKQDGCAYPDIEPAKSYLDDWCSYASNEIAINWNAPLVYVLAAIQQE